jgi:hypothetical protein
MLAEAAAKKQNEPGAAAAIADILVQVDTVHANVLLFGRNYEDLREAAQQVIEEVALEAREVRVGVGSSVLTADMNKNAYVSLDTGMAYAWQLES